jgi:hypothetical protein
MLVVNFVVGVGPSKDRSLSPLGDFLVSTQAARLLRPDEYRFSGHVPVN